MAQDAIILKGLRVFGYHGVFQHERDNGQEFLIDVELFASIRRAGESDEMADTIDYGTLADEIVAVVAGDPVNLIETLAERIGRTCLDKTTAERVAVTVHKPDAPIQHQFADVAVRIEREREDI